LVKVEADLDENAALLAEYDVVSLPTIVLKIGDEAWATIVGIKPEAELRKWIDTHITIAESLGFHARKEL
jgi:thioredoxin-like negative regulator of GroEL